ncbi:lipopolysaccharide heptosyltransferase I [Ralstonia solanacearum]|uniref:lipopolysaccharide heptosyltransferase I n=1 Tax=Ralstonia solanacearum TaxID=305 RepID=UPI0035141555
MKRILIVKMTSLGDVIQTLPVVTDIRRAFPGVEVDWAVDESCADVVRMSPGVSRVLSAPLRRFKKTRSPADLRAILALAVALRRHRYDAVLDLHGVYKSAIVSFVARARRRFGYRNPDLGERGARFAYNRRFGPRPACNAWHGMRISAGEALGYMPQGFADYGIATGQGGEPAQGRQAIGTPYALFFHATSKDDKKWPSGHWAGLAREMLAGGLRVLLPWHSVAELHEALRIAALAPGAAVMPRMSIAELARKIDGAAAVVGVDTGLVHMAHAMKKPTVMIFLATSRDHCGIAAPRSLSIGGQGWVPGVDDVLGGLARVLPEFGVSKSAIAA